MKTNINGFTWQWVPFIPAAAISFYVMAKNWISSITILNAPLLNKTKAYKISISTQRRFLFLQDFIFGDEQDSLDAYKSLRV